MTNKLALLALPLISLTLFYSTLPNYHTPTYKIYAIRYLQCHIFVNLITSLTLQSVDKTELSKCVSMGMFRLIIVMSAIDIFL